MYTLLEGKMWDFCTRLEFPHLHIPHIFSPSHALILTPSQFPQQLLEVKASLRTLDLSTNKLARLPPIIGDFTTLRSLNLSHNRLG